MRFSKYLLSALAGMTLLSPAACSLNGSSESALSGQKDGGVDGDCTLTQGYWKNHPEAWPVSSLKLGTVTYTKAELILILKTPVKGNGLISLAHQLIAAKLNIAAGASDAAVKVAIQQADALIGNLVCPPKGEGELKTSATGSLIGDLDAYNNGAIGPGHCGDDDGDHCDGDTDGDGQCDGDDDDDDDNTCDHDEDGDGVCDGDEDDHEEEPCDQPEPVCGNGTMEGAEACDDGNTTAGDGCSPTCTIELPVCGNGVIETGETCDDGNTNNGDGCSSVCICEPCH